MLICTLQIPIEFNGKNVQFVNSNNARYLGVTKGKGELINNKF